MPVYHAHNEPPFRLENIPVQIDPRNDRMETPAQPRDKQDIVIIGYNSQPAEMDRGPLITPMHNRERNEFMMFDERPNARNPDRKYHPIPRTLLGFPGSQRVSRQADRARCKFEDKILEWDRQHGEIEMFDRRGKHMGAFDPNTGEKIKNDVPGRRIEI